MVRTEAIVNLSDAAVAQVMIPLGGFQRGIAFYRDVLGSPLLFVAPPDIRLALMSEVAPAGA